MNYKEIFLHESFNSIKEHYIEEVSSDVITRIKKILNALDMYKKTLPLYNKITCPIYYINMDQHIDRNEFMKNQLRHYSNRVTRIPGFNGYAISNIKHDTINSISFSNKSYCTKSEVGCFISHILAIKKAYDNGDEMAMILEDDTDLSLFNISLPFDTFIKDAPSDWEMINLFHFETNINNIVHKYTSPLGNTYLIHNSKFPGSSCVGYIINKKGMKKALEDFTLHSDTNFTVVINEPIDFILQNTLNTYILEKDLVFPNNINLKSTIHDNHTSMHVNRILKTLEYYSSSPLLEKYL